MPDFQHIALPQSPNTSIHLQWEPYVHPAFVERFVLNLRVCEKIDWDIIEQNIGSTFGVWGIFIRFE
jgi:hypothetical protein